MIEKKNQAKDPSDLRRKAEKALSLKEAKHSKLLSAEEMERNLHELRVHQIELELQNEELLKTQAELDAERARYFDLYFLAPLGYVTVTEKGMISEANLATASMLGVPRGTLLNCPFYRFIFKEDQDIFYLHRRQLFESGETKPFEIRLLKKDGTVFWVYFAETITQDANSVSVTRITLSDITERKRAEDALLESHQIIKGIMDAIPVRVFWKDKNLVFLGCNEVFARDAGFTDPKDIIGKDDYQMVWRDQAELYRNDDRQVIESGRPKLLIEEPQTTPEGKIITLLTSKMPMFNASDEINGVIVTYIDITERKEAEAALRESESRYATTLAALDDGLWDWHVPSGKAFFSSTYYRMLGYEDREFPASYDSWRGLVHPDDIGRVEQGLRQGLESGKGFNVDLRMKNKSGEWLWVCTRGKVVEKDADGKALRMVGTLSDISERKQAERRQVLLSEILSILNRTVALPDILNGVLSAIKMETGFDAVGIRLKSGEDFPYFSQDGFSKDFLLSENTLAAHDMHGEVCRDKNGNIILECTCGLVISGKTDPANPLFTPGGSFWTNNSFPLLDLPSDQDPRLHPRNRRIHDGYGSVALIPIRANQEIVGLLQLNNREKDSLTLDKIHFFEDICASLGIALMQKQAEDNYRTLFNEMLDGFALHEIICDSEGNPADYRFLAVNPAFERMTGLKTEEIVGRTVLEVMPDTERYWIETYGKVALTGEPVSLENYSAELNKHFNVTAFRPAPRQFACIFTDITVRKQGEEEKSQLEQQLLESQKMQAIGQLAGGISHDFNNLLSVINGYSQLLVRNPDLKPVAVQQVEEILKAGERAAGLTRQLLVFSRRQTMEFKVIDLNTIVSGTSKMLRRIVRENIEMVIIEGPNLGKIKADPGQIEQVIMNLVVNASDSMLNGGSITIKTENVEFYGDERVHHQVIKSGPYVVLSVSDTGCGMDDKVREHIFEPFFTTKGIGKGTGLGLAIIYGIVKQANAYIDVQSELGKGTRFQIYFPQIVEEMTAEEERCSVASFPGGTETILISEDEESIRLMLEDFLKSIGYTVLVACNGKEALDLAGSHKGKIHILLTDIVMPGMNGFELAKRLKKVLPGIKLLFMSGYIKPTSTQEMMKISNNLIDKPVSIHDLSVKLREILG